jgi:hypothetical protein
VETHPYRALYVLDPASFELIYGPEERRDLAARLDFYAPAQSRESILENLSLLREAEIILAVGDPRSWTMGTLDELTGKIARHLVFA